MEVLHAGWRSEYINAPRGTDTHKTCIFCEYPKRDDDEENLLLHRGQEVFVLMNRYPYSTGHLMVIPYRHTSDYASLTEVESAEMIRCSQRAVEVLKEVMHCDGINLGMNLGTSAGAGIAEHLHLHVVPRWNGDTNFMSVTAETKVLPESLIDTYRRLRAVWQR